MIMPNDACEELCHTYSMPLSIPKSGDTISRTDLHYMSFEEAMKEAFTDIHQLSLRDRRRANSSPAVGQVEIGDRELRSSESDQDYSRFVYQRGCDLQGLREASLPILYHFSQ